MPEKSTKTRRPRVPQRYYPAGNILAQVFRWHHIRVGRSVSWRLTFRIKALAKLADIPVGEDARDTYLDALAALQSRGELDSPEVQKHTAELEKAAEQAKRWHNEMCEREEAGRRADAHVAAPPVPVADFDADPWDEPRDEFEQFLDEVEPDGEASE